VPERDLYRGLVHPLLAATAPAALLVPLGNLAADLSAGILPGWPLLLPLALAVGGVGVALGNLLDSERAGGLSRLRELVLISGAVYLLASLAGVWIGPPAGAGTPLESLAFRLKPSWFSAWLTGFAFVQWNLTASFQRSLRARELFLEEVEGLSGPPLQTAVRDAGDLSEEALAGLRRLGGLTSAFAAVMVLAWLALAAAGMPARPASLIAALPCFLYRPFIRSLIAQYSLEHEAAGEGLRVDAVLRRKRLRAAGLLIAAAAAVGLALSAEASLLPAAWIVAVFNWLFSAKLGGRLIEPPERPPEDGNQQLAQALRQLGEAAGPPLFDLSKFLAALRPYLVAAAIAAAAYFLAAPLFSRYFRDSLRGRSLAKALAAKWRQLLAWLLRGRAKDAPAARLDDADLEPLRRALADISRRRVGLEKRREVGRLTRLYLRLVAWGSARAYPYGRAAAPGEYAVRLAAAFPDLSAQLRTAGEVFEEALYSDRLVDGERQRAFKAAVEAVLAYRA
jgi:cobalamin synthase